MSAPTGKPMWENPCGNKHLRDSSEQLPIAERLDPLLVATRNALTKARHFSEQWVGKIFHSTVEAHHGLWSATYAEWLPSKEEMPKKFGQDLSQDELNKMLEQPLTTILKLVHKNMQMYAVGLEQAFHDQSRFNDGWSDQFRKMQIENKQVLCELETVLVNHDEKDLANIQRDVMALKYRDDKYAGSRNLRDWLILRDFMTNLEYIIQLCEFVIKLEDSARTTTMNDGDN